MRRGVDPDSIPRYEIPEQVYTDYDDEPATGACWNCDHMTEITLGGKSYMLCALERDVSASGDLTECDIDLRDCKDWDEYDL